MVRWHALIRRYVRKQAALIRKSAAHDHLRRFKMILSGERVLQQTAES
jgi:hypothetical protein